MNSLYRNPGTYVALALLGLLTVALFAAFPVAAPTAYCLLISYVIVSKLRLSLRFRRRGYCVSFVGREILRYEEADAGGKNRHLDCEYGHVSGRTLGIYWPSDEAWQQRMPDWAKGRRDEILSRIRQDLGGRLVKCVETEHVISTQPVQPE